MSYTQAWMAGTRAYFTKVEKNANPNKFGTEEFGAWNDGWDDGAIVADPKNPDIGRVPTREEVIHVS